MTEFQGRRALDNKNLAATGEANQKMSSDLEIPAAE